MVEILRNKNLVTRFQILVEIATMQPNIQQRYIARRLSITPQAVSDYIKQLLRDRLLTSGGRSRYRVSTEGVDWMLRQLKEAQEYFGSVEKAVSNIKVSAAVADDDLSQGQTVGLVMRDGLLVATSDLSVGAKGVAVSAAASGEDVGVANIQGIIHLKTGEVTILEVTAMQKGGSRNVDLVRLQSVARDRKPIACIGIEALTALKRIGIQPDCIYGAREAVIEAANRGLSPVLVCVDEEVPMLIRRLDEAGIKHELSDLRVG
jgi:putative transcriptional regulator